MKKSNPKSPTIKDVAEYANLSVATVSRVINGSRPVKNGLSQKVWEAVKTLNYKPNAAARFIKGQRTGNIALIIPDIADPFFGHIAKGVLSQAHKNGVMVNISSSQGNRRIEQENIKQLASFVIDGLLYAPVATAEPLPQMDIFRGLPLVVMGRRFIFKNVPHIYTDNIKGGYTATKYLLKLGRNKIAFLAGFWDPPCSAEEIPGAALTDWAGSYSSLDRFIGYLNAQKEYGLELDSNLVATCGYTFESGYESAKKLFSKMVEIDSLIAPNDMVATGAMAFLKDQGYSIPKDVSIIGYDDLLPPTSSPKLTTIKQYPEEIGEKSLDFLLRLIEGKPASDHIVDISLIIRESTCFFSG